MNISSQYPDFQFCSELRQGKEEAFECLFNQYNRLLYTIAYRFLKSEEEAEDAVQYTFMKLWEEREKLDLQQGVRSLLYAIIKNYIMNELRHKRVVYEKNYQLAQQTEEATDEFWDAYEQQNLHEQLLCAINRLPSQKSMICKMKLKQGMSNQEIATLMHITVATVKSHYTQAVKMLRSGMMPMSVALIVLL